MGSQWVNLLWSCDAIGCDKTCSLLDMYTDPESFSPMICQINGALTFFVYYFDCFFLRLIITCRLWVIYVRELFPMYIRLWLHSLYGLYGPRCPVPKKADKLNLSLSVHYWFRYWLGAVQATRLSLIQLMAWPHIGTKSMVWYHDIRY